MPGTEKRWYHSTGVLLPDGSVMSAGSNNEYNGRIYYPAYFGQTRPMITSAPTTVSYGQSFNIEVTSNGLTIGKVTMIRLNATTHGYDQGQRLIVCDFAATENTYAVTPPANGANSAARLLHAVCGIDQRPAIARKVRKDRLEIKMEDFA